MKSQFLSFIFSFLLTVALFGAPLSAAESFFSPPQSSGSITVKLYPMENVSPGLQTLATFGMPFTRGSVSETDLNKVRVLRNGSEIPAYVEQLTPWRHLANSSIDGQSVRIVRIQINYTFSVSYPNYEEITVEWGGTARTQSINAFTNPRSAWHLATGGTFDPGDGVYEPDVYAVLPRSYLTLGAVRPMRMEPLDGSISPERDNPEEIDAIATWPGFLEMEHALKNNFFTHINEDNPAAGANFTCFYKTEFEPWLYDRASTFYVLYLRSGWLKPLREAVRAAEFYRTQIYPEGFEPNKAVGIFKLKSPDPNKYIGANGAMYSYSECLAYTHWLTGDEEAKATIPAIVMAHDELTFAEEKSHWSPTQCCYTERHLAIGLTANAVAYEVFGDTAIATKIQQLSDDFIWHQNGAGGQIPNDRIDGGLYHYGSQHGDGTQNALVGSPWMAAAMCDAMVRVYSFTESNEVAHFIRRLGYFEKAATKYTANSLYGSAPRWFPDYMTRYDGASDDHRDDTVEHALDVGVVMAWADYFAELLNLPEPSFKESGSNLYATYDFGVNYWVRPQQPGSELTSFRVSPWRKYNWEHRIAGSLSWIWKSPIQKHFTFTANTGNNAVVAIPVAANPNIGGVSLAAGDEIGAYTPSGLCVGAAVWQEANAAITVWGDDSQTTGVVDGIVVGEEISYRIWSKATDTEYTDVKVTYSLGDGIYGINANFVLAFIGVEQQPSQPELILDVAPSQPIDTEFFVDLTVNGVQNLFGISFELNYTNTTFVDIVAPEDSSVTAGPFLGNDLVFLKNVDDANGKIGIGISQKHGQVGVSGNGVVARIKMKAIKTTVPGTDVVFSVKKLFANDSTGKAIQLTSADTTVVLQGLEVWPGDTDNNGVVDQKDILPIGQAWGKTGPARKNVSIVWNRQIAPLWTPLESTYIDANGDGVIDQTDVLAVGLNFSKSRSTTLRTKGSQQTEIVAGISGQTTLRTTLRGEIASGEEFWLDVQVDAASDLFGMAFDLTCAPASIFSVEEVSATRWMGDDYIFFPVISRDSGKISVGLSRKAGQGGIDGSGVLMSIRIKPHAKDLAGQSLKIVFDNIAANDQQGKPVQIITDSQVYSEQSDEQNEITPQSFALLQNYPNPFNPSTTINYSLPKESRVCLTIFNMLGQQVKALVDETQAAGVYQVKLEMDAQPSGIYFYRLQAGAFSQLRKMLLVR